MVAQLCRTTAPPHDPVALSYMPNDFVRESLNETVGKRWCKRHRNDGGGFPFLFGKFAPAHPDARTQHYIVRSSSMMQLVEDITYLVNYLMDERGAGAQHIEPQEDPRWFMEQWEQFRALGEHARAEARLAGVSEGAGPRSAADGGRAGHHRGPTSCPRIASDERLTLWRGDITGAALRCHRQRREQRASGLLDSRPPVHR